MSACIRSAKAPRRGHCDLNQKSAVSGPRLSGAGAAGLGWKGSHVTLRASYDAAAVWRNVDTSDRLVMALELVLELKGISDLAVELDARVSCHGEDAVVGREGVVGDWVVEQVVNLGSSHFEGFDRMGSDRSSSLLSREALSGECWNDEGVRESSAGRQ